MGAWSSPWSWRRLGPDAGERRAGRRKAERGAEIRYAHGVGKVRDAERALMARLPEGTLMRRAAAGLASVCARLLPRVYGSRVVLLVGSGDNGGDALFAGARLARRGARVDAVIPKGESRVHQPGLSALLRSGGVIATAEDVIDDADLVVDGLLGIGGRGGLRDPYQKLAVRAAEVDVPVVAVDVPSGVDASTGRVEGVAVRADITVTFGTLKPGLLIDPGATFAGVVELVDIGLGGDLPDPDVCALQAGDVAAMLPEPVTEVDKYRRGVLGVVAGSETFTGAAVLAVGGAIFGGAGMVRFVSRTPAVEVVRQEWPEAVTTIIDPDAAGESIRRAGRVQAWVAGPGMGTDEAAAESLEAVLATDLPVLIDADGITLVSRHLDWLRRRNAATVLTPQARELTRLIGRLPDEVEAARLEHVTRAASELGATVLLKGSTTLVAEEGRPVRVNPTGTWRLATAGSGDVLSGLCGALLATGLDPLDAASAGAYLHGVAARIASDGAPISAGEVVAAVPEAFRSLTAAERFDTDSL